MTLRDLGLLPDTWDAKKHDFSYDAQADVLYISFDGVLNHSTNSIPDDRGRLWRFNDGRLVGLTIMDFTNYVREEAAAIAELRTALPGEE